MEDTKQVELGGDVYGKLDDGTLVATDAFQVGHMLIVISEDGSKTLAPDADHIVYVPGSSMVSSVDGGTKRYFITTKGGQMTSINLEDNSGAIKVEASKSENKNMKTENQSTKLAVDEVKVDGPMADDEKTFEEKDPIAEIEKEEKMQDEASRLDSLEEQLNQLRVDIAQLFEAMKGKGENMESEEDKEDEMMKKKEMMSASKKFTGAPVEEKSPLDGLLKHKNNGTLDVVMSRMSNPKYKVLNN